MTVLWSFRLSCKLKDVLWNTDSLLKNFQLYQTSAKNMLYTWIRAEHTHIVGIWRDAHILEIEWGGRSHVVEQVTTGIIRPTIHNLGNFCGLASTVLPYFNIGTFRSTALSQWDMTICVQTCGLQAVHLEWVGGAHWLLFRQWLCFTQRFPPMKGFRILPLAVKSLLFVLTLKLFFKATITFPLIFLIISIKMGRNRLQMGSKEVCSAWFPLPTSTLVEEVEKWK